MDMDKIIEKMRDVIQGELKQKFAQFKASVTGELSGFRLALDSIAAMQSSMENDLREIRHSIDGASTELGTRIDTTFFEVSKLRGDLEKAMSQKTIIDDLIARVSRL